jgi:hypothetical protein
MNEFAFPGFKLLEAKTVPYSSCISLTVYNTQQ